MLALRDSVDFGEQAAHDPQVTILKLAHFS
jgi:hypothetical protein